jgi:hypothetical protein
MSLPNRLEEVEAQRKPSRALSLHVGDRNVAVSRDPTRLISNRACRPILIVRERGGRLSVHLTGARAWWQKTRKLTVPWSGSTVIMTQ